MKISTLAILALLAVPTAANATSFTYSTLDNPGDPTFNQLLGINDHGVIVGYFGSGAVGHPNIGYEIAPPYTTFQSNNEPGSAQTQATGINNEGVTTGFWSDTNTGSDNNFGFIRMPTGKNFTYVDANDPNVGIAPHVDQALGINNNGVVAGFYNDANGNAHGFTYTVATAEYTQFTISGVPSVANTGINDSGETCGFYVKSNGSNVGFVRNASGTVFNKFQVPGSKVTQFLGINNKGIAVGFYTDSSNINHGLYYNAGTGVWSAVNQPNGVGGTVVNGINNKNELVGFYIDAAGNYHGMVVTVMP